MSLPRCLLCLCLIVTFDTVGITEQEPQPEPRVVIETSEGNITVELFRSDARASVVNFLTYVQNGFYDGTVFHRVIKNFMIQGGGYTQEIAPKTDGLRGGILNEAANRIQNRRGTLAMARSAKANSARAQFFINLIDNRSLNHKDRSDRGFGYAVFGKVVEGMSVVDKIGSTATHSVDGLRDVPRNPIVIKTIKRLN